MHTPTNSSIALANVGLTWPDGTTALTGITGTFGAGRTGLVGANGSGKSTLLRLIAGRLTPTTGRLDAAGDVDHLPQTLTLSVHATVSDLLGVTDKVAALRAIEAGDVSDHRAAATASAHHPARRADEQPRPR